MLFENINIKPQHRNKNIKLYIITPSTPLAQ